MDFRRILAALGGIGVDPTAREAVEALWLAARIAECADDGAREPTQRSALADEASAAPPRAPLEPGSTPRPPVSPSRAGAQRLGPATLHTSPPTGAASRTDTPAVAVRVPAAPALTGELDLLRALRPLKRQVPSRHRVVLDEIATAERSAEERLFLPTTRPDPDRWFSLVIVMEASPSMTVWHSLVSELIVLLQRSGAFRDIRLWHLHTGADGKAGLHPRALPTSALHSPGEILDPTGRQIVWCVSDCVSALWRDGRADRLLELWGGGGPLAIVQPLPQRLWRRSGLRPERVSLQSNTPGEPNSRLRTTGSDLSARNWTQVAATQDPPDDFAHRDDTMTLPQHAGALNTQLSGIPVPVLELESSWLAPWARLVTATAAGGVSAIVTRTRTSPDRPATPEQSRNGSSTSDAPATTEQNNDDSNAHPSPQDPLSLVRTFRANASPEAYRLAGCLAAAPLTLSVMRLVQRVMLPASRPAHLAEVLVSGLLRRTGIDPGAPEYDFIDGVRDVLLSTIRLSDTRRVYDEVSSYLAAHVGDARDTVALAVLPTGQGDLTVPDPSRPYADVPPEVLRRLGRGRAPEGNDAILQRPPLTDSAEQDAAAQPATGRAEPVQISPGSQTEAAPNTNPTVRSDATSTEPPASKSRESRPTQPRPPKAIGDSPPAVDASASASSETKAEVAERRLDVVLVHGYLSRPTIWDPLRQRIAADNALGFVDTHTFQWKTGKRLSPQNLSKDIDLAAGALNDYLSALGDASRLMLVTHAQGGLIVQRFLEQMLFDRRGRELARIRQVALLACPTSDSEAAAFLHGVHLGVGQPQKLLQKLQWRTSRTQQTVLEGIVHARQITDRTCPIPFSVYAGQSDAVVAPYAARGAFPNSGVLPGDHFSILTGHDTFTTLRRLILETDADSADRVTVQQASSSTVSVALARLPRPSPAFAGREEDVEALLRMLDPSASGAEWPVLAVTGVGGVGKTQLVLHVAERAFRLGWFPGGALFVDLNPALSNGLSASDALGSLLSSLDVPPDNIPADEAARSAMLRSTLGTRASQGQRFLLVLDNADSERQLLPVLPDDNGYGVLITSRQTIPSPLALHARTHRLDVLAPQASVDLIRQVLADNRVDDAPESAKKLATLCGGLPLALRIVAGRLADNPQRSLAYMAEELSSEEARLAGLSTGHVSVRAAFDASYQHLSHRQARLFRLLPLNAGSDISTAAAARLTDEEESTTEELLNDLAAANLVEVASTVGRWRMHDLIRLYADDHSRNHTDERHQAATRLMDYYLTTAEAANTHLKTPTNHAPSPVFSSRDQAVAWLESELGNLTTAAIAASQHHRRAQTELVLDLTEFLSRRHHLGDWTTFAFRAVAILQESGDRVGEGKAWNNFGLALVEARRYEEAIEAHATSAAVFLELGDRVEEGRALSNLGLALVEVGRVEEAIEVQNQAVAIFQQSGDRVGEGRAQSNLGVCFQQVGRQEEAIEAHTRAINILRESGERDREGGALFELGLVLREAGRYGEAIEAHTRAVDLFRESGDRDREGAALIELASAREMQGRNDSA
ncbi:SAV_2336 N-terminal domain-related protein [Streptomyces sp. NPDC006475]|uniref:SAV_2336 N-terminal domain-related protein n=1 Tax=Streptomyces sp. NPDC006475 TaxID=3155719 RepID=UPI0033AEF9F7